MSNNPEKGCWVEIDGQPGVNGVLTGNTGKLGPVDTWEVEMGPGDRRMIPNELLITRDQGSDNNLNLIQLIETDKFASISELRRIITHEKLRGALTDIIYSMDAAQIDFYPYQFKPVLKFIQSPADRLILADEVGLGKTIESALIWLELKARREAKRLLVICPKMLEEKWKKELRDKFQIDSLISSFQDLQNTLLECKSIGPHHSFAVIATYTGIKCSREEAKTLGRGHYDDAELSPKGKFLHSLRNWESNFAPFDLVVFDEAQAMRNPSTAAYRMGESLAMHAGAVLCVSATPLATSNEDLRTLLRLIDPDFFDDQFLFNTLINANRPAVQASNYLSASPPNIIEAKDAINSLKQMEFFKDSKLVEDVYEELCKLDRSNKKDLVRAQENVEQLNILGQYVTRTRRVQVQEMKSIRVPKIIKLDYSEGERDLYDAIVRFVREKASFDGNRFHIFAVINWQLRAASCLPAIVNQIKNKIQEIEGDLIEDSDISVQDDSTSDSLFKYSEEWGTILSYDFENNDSKYKALEKLLQNDFKYDKCIIFSFFRATLSYLARRLSAVGINIITIHGGVNQSDREIRIDKFSQSDDRCILLSSEVGSEGIDLQFCSIVINYDLPWNPMRIEQRIGRIDRVGQKAKQLKIVHFQFRNTIEERVYEKLHARIEMFRNSLGDLDAVLGEEVEKLRLDLFSSELTAKQEMQRIEQTALAIEKHHKMLMSLEDSADGLLSVGDYLQNKIRESRGLGRFLTPNELEDTLIDFFNRCSDGTEFRWGEPVKDCFRIKLSFERHGQLMTYLGNDNSSVPSRLRTRDFSITVRPDVINELDSKNNKKVIFINHLSPLIRWITKSNQNEWGLYHKLIASRLVNSEYGKGTWFFLCKRLDFTGALSKKKIAYIVLDSNEQVITDKEAEIFVQTLINDGKAWDYNHSEAVENKQKYDKANSMLDEEIGKELSYYSSENDRYIKIRLRRAEVFFDRRINSAKQAIETAKVNNNTRILPALEGRLKSESNKKEERIKSIGKGAKSHIEVVDVACGIVLVE